MRGKDGLARLAVMALVAWIAACSSSSGRLIPDYEVLKVPVGADRYPAGARWNAGTRAPDAGVIVAEPIRTVAGLDELKSSDADDAEFQLQVPILEWIGGSLGIENKDALKVELKGLEHRFVTDSSRIAARMVLYETITASSIDLSVDERLAGGIDVSVDALEAKLGVAGTVSAQASGTSENAFTIRADHPLVVAIRVVEVEFQDAQRVDGALDLSTPARNRAQEVGLGYRLTPRLVDEITRSVSASISNDAFPGFGSQEVAFTPENQFTWINPKSEAIASGDDPRAKEAQFVWDTITVQLEPDLDQSRISVVRQYILRTRTVDSGLDTL